MKTLRSKVSVAVVAIVTLLAATSCDVKRLVVLRQMANFFEKVERNPVIRTPAEAGLAYEDVNFKSLDEVDLSAWFIPNDTTDKLVVFNHFMMGNKAGAVPHEDWGNVAVDFLPIYESLVNAGYSVLTYDLRNHGESDVYKNGALGLTLTEYQDVVASVRYAKKQYPDKDVYLYSQCYGTVATMRAMDKHPEDFKEVKAYINLQPLTPEGFVAGVTKKFDMEHEDNLDIFGKQLEKKTGYTLEQLEVPANSVKVPTMMVQVHDDWRTTAESIKEIYDNLGTIEKKMLWIEDEDERLEGYNYFARNPAEMIAWFNKY